MRRTQLAVIIPADGKAPHAPTDESRAMVAAMVACGLDECQIAQVMKITPADVTYHYAYELEHGTAVTNAQVGAACLRSALKGDVNAQKFWLERRAGWAPPKPSSAVEDESTASEAKDKKVRRQLMDDIVSLLASDKVVQDLGQTTAQSNPGSKRMQ